MYWSLVYYLDTGADALDRIRRKYDPTFDLIRPHVPVVFPVPESVGKERLLAHLDAVAGRSRLFPARFRGFAKTPDHWLYLKVEEGSADFVQLFESSYTGPLAEFRRHDVEFVPHVGLGLFVKKDTRYDMSATPTASAFDESSYQRALKEARAEEIDLRATVSSLDLVELEDRVLEWARGQRPELPSDGKARTAFQWDLS